MNFNLVPESRRRARKRRARVRLWASLGTVYLVVLLVAYGSSLAMWGGDGQDLQERLRKTSARLEQSRNHARDIRRRLLQARQALAANRAVGEQPDWSALLRLISASLGEDLVLTRCRLGPEGHLGRGLRKRPAPVRPSVGKRRRFALELSGLGRSQKAITRFLLRLEKARLFEQVSLLRTAREPFLTGSAIRFDVRCLMGASDPEAGAGARAGAAG